MGADDPASVPLFGSPSISKFLTLDPESISHEDSDSSSSRADSPIPSSPEAEGLMLPVSCLEDSPTHIPILEAVKTTSAQSAPSSPAPSKTSCSLDSQIAEKPQASIPSLQVSPSRQQEDSQTPSSLPRSPSEPRIELSSKSLPASPHPEPLDVNVQAPRSVPDLSPLLLFPLVSDALLASPTTPTLSPSVCYSTSEASDSTPTADNGDLIASPVSDVMPIQGRADITPFAVKSSEGGILSREVILEGPEPFPDEDDLDPFAASPSSPSSIPTVVTTPPSRYGLTTASPEYACLMPLSSRLRNRSSTLGPPPLASRSPSLMGLRRTLTNSLFLRPRSRTTMSHLEPTNLSPPPSPLEVKVHNRSTIYEETTRIDDDEIRRLSELAFLT
jgi:hypothetical protein